MGFLEKLFRKKLKTPTQMKEEGTLELSQPIKRGFVSANPLKMDGAGVNWLKKRYIAFDVETTGLSPEGNRIIEVGAVIFENGEVVKKYGTLIDAGISVPATVTAINHITDEMLAAAPREKFVYPELVSFLGNALEGQTAICAHNARFDMEFLSETLMRLGYDGKIIYTDALSLARGLVKGLKNYKLGTVAEHFGIFNKKAHRAVSDAETCGRILWELLLLREAKEERTQKYLEKTKPTDEELEVCAYIQDLFMKNDKNTEFLEFYKNGAGYINIYYHRSLLEFKLAKRRKYVIVEKGVEESLNLPWKPCSMGEGGERYVRILFESPFDLEPLSTYILASYEKCYEARMRYYSDKTYWSEGELEDMISGEPLFSSAEVEELLQSAHKREELRILQKQEAERAALEEELEKQRKTEEKKAIAEAKKAEDEARKATAPKYPNGRAILRMSDNMEILQEYVTVSEAVRETGINGKSIREAAKGRQKHAGGYVWRYADEYEK